MTGRRLLHYEITEKLGEGGMGVVYKARDTHLDRFVAIKVLPAEKVADPERKRRFIQEAKAASALNHPHIIHVYDISADSGHDFIAMEFVEGKTLDAAIPRTGMRLAEALKIAIQIASALAAAHAKGIVHRDLKPANVMVTPDGTVKIFDFGLAKLTEPTSPSPDAETRTMKAPTEEGTILGTVAYMSPEQAEGKPVDARSDVFSFGALLYEMMTGRRAFQGDSRIATLSAVMHQEPRPLEGVPQDLRRIITHCLRKDPERRFQHMKDLKVELEELNEETDSGTLAPAVLTLGATGSRRWILVAAVLSLVLAVCGGVAWWLPRLKPSTESLVLSRLTFDSGLTADPALSPDGKLLAYSSDRGGEGNLDIWIQQIAGGEPIRLTRDPADDSEPSFSPDGSRIAFRSARAGGGVYIVSALGGDARLLVKEGRTPRFSPDGSEIAYWVGHPKTGTAYQRGAARIFVVPVAGGTPQQLASQFDVAFRPAWLPSGRRVVFGGQRESGIIATRDFYVAPLDGGAIMQSGFFEMMFGQKLSPVGPYPTVVPAEANRWIFAARLGDSVNLWQVAVSPKTGKVEGAVQRLTSGAGLEDQPSVASGGRLVFASITQDSRLWRLPLFANKGKVLGELQQLTQGAASDIVPAASADGRRVVFISNRSGSNQVWSKDVETGREVALTASRVYLHQPAISRDGNRVAYREIVSGNAFDRKSVTNVLSTAGVGVPEKVCDDCGQLHDWSLDGASILHQSIETGGIAMLEIASGKNTVLLRDPKYSLWQANFSPDDRWIGFLIRLAPDRLRVMIAPFRPAEIPAHEWIAVTDGITDENKPRWSPDGNLLYFSSERDQFRCIWAQPLDPMMKRPRGDPIAVYHSHDPHRSLGILDIYSFQLSVTRDALVFNMGERSGNLWMAQITGK